MNSRPRLLFAAAFVTAATALSQVPAPDLPRPGAIQVSELNGRALAVNGDQRKPLKSDERLRVGTTIETERRSTAALQLSNGALVQVGPDSELEIEEFGQAPVSGSIKFAELKEEPSVSRTRLRLARGDVQVALKPLKASRGSTFTLTLLAGTLRIREGTFRARIQMSDLGLGVCTIELPNGLADFEPVGGKFQPLRAGQKLAFAIEQDKRTGVVKIGEMPKGKADAR